MLNKIGDETKNLRFFYASVTPKSTPSTSSGFAVPFSVVLSKSKKNIYF